MIADLADLVAPLTVADFRARLRHRAPLSLRAARDVSSLLDWDGFIAAALHPDLPAKRLSLVQGGVAMPQLFYRANGQAKRDVILKVMGAGGSLIAYNAHRFVPALDRLCGALAAETGEHVIAALIGSTGAHSAYDVHYDEGDVLVMQIEGSKRWIIEVDPVVDPVPGAAIVPGHAGTMTLMDPVLNPGDMLLVPAGYRHHCEMTSEKSLHVSLMFFPLTAPRAADLLLRDLLDEPAARHAIRCDPGEEADSEAALKRLLIERVEAMTLDALRAMHRDKDLPRSAKS